MHPVTVSAQRDGSKAVFAQPLTGKDSLAAVAEPVSGHVHAAGAVAIVAASLPFTDAVSRTAAVLGRHLRRTAHLQWTRKSMDCRPSHDPIRWHRLCLLAVSHMNGSLAHCGH